MSVGRQEVCLLSLWALEQVWMGITLQLPRTAANTKVRRAKKSGAESVWHLNWGWFTMLAQALVGSNTLAY